MEQRDSRRIRRWLGLVCWLPVLLSGCAPADQDSRSGENDLVYAAEYPGIAYASTEPEGSLGSLAARVSAGETMLRRSSERGYLDAVLEQLGIDPVSQVLVYSRTSLQTRQIHPTTPRAIYFNDENYVAWVPDAPSLELSAFDPALGPVFYRLTRSADEEPTMERQFGVCLRCHDTYGMSGGGVPRFLLGSGYTGTDGELVSHEAWILTSQATPLRSRWGGWYVTGAHGTQVHLGNIVVDSAEDLRDLESLRVGNIADLNGLFDTSHYLTPYSDIVALMVLEHQIQVQNSISRLRFEAASATGGSLEPHVEGLVRAMLMADEIELTDRISDSSGFAEYFESLGPVDSDGRSLRGLDLRSRLFRYPLSYLIYSDAFQALQPKPKAAVYARLREILRTDPVEDSFSHLTDADRAAIAEILRNTLPAVFEL